MSKAIAVVDSKTNAVSGEDLFNQVAAGVGLVNGQKIDTIGTQTLTITRKTTGLVIILICILLFPIGLLALLARQTEAITITVKETGDGVRASAIGKGDDQVVGFLNELLAPS